MTPWRQLSTRERISLVQYHHLPGISASKIAASIGMGVTRNAVVGIYERNRELKLTHPLGGNVGKCFPAKPRRVAMVAIKKPVVQKPVPIAKPTRPEFRHVDLLDLKSGECKWPAGNGPYTFCGQDAEFRSYCAFHHRLAHSS